MNFFKVFKKEKKDYFNINDIKINNNSYRDKLMFSKINNQKNILFEIKSKTDKPKKLKSIIDYTDDELNNLSFDLALQNEKKVLLEIIYFINKNKT